MDGQVSHGFHTHSLVKVTVSLELSARRSGHTSWGSHHVPHLLGLPSPPRPRIQPSSAFTSVLSFIRTRAALALLTTPPPRPLPHSLHPGLYLLSDLSSPSQHLALILLPLDFLPVLSLVSLGPTHSSSSAFTVATTLVT